MRSKEEKIEKILQFTRDNNISAYEIAKNTKLTEAGIGKILNKSSKNPREMTVDAIFDYLFNNEKIDNKTSISNFKNGEEVNITSLLRFLLDNNKELMKEQSFRNYILMNSVQINYEETKEENNKEIERLKKEAIEKYRKKDI